MEVTAQRVPLSPLSDTFVDLVSLDDLISWLARPATSRRLLLGHNLHSVYLAERSREFREIYRGADLVVADGFPVWIAARLARPPGGGPARRRRRIGSTDWIPLLDRAERPLKIAVIGATAESNARAVTVLSGTFPNHIVTGWDGYDAQRNLVRTDFEALVKFGPDVVLVGMGMPYQEQWLQQSWARLPVATYAAVGGAIDQVSGAQAAAPRWLGSVGLEWLWRLCSDPRRLAGRYLVEPCKLVSLLVIRNLRSRRS